MGNDLKCFKSRLVHKKFEIKIIKNSNKTDSDLCIRNMGAERKYNSEILRGIFGPTKENQTWRIKNNDKLDKLIKHQNIFLLLVKHELAPGSLHLFTLVMCMAGTSERCDIFTALF